jgi:Uracil phosphoribosyltransferase
MRVGGSYHGVVAHVPRTPNGYGEKVAGVADDDVVFSPQVHHLGMYHESLTDCCVMYYNRLPAEVDADVAVVLEPVVGSGGWCF